MTMTPLQEALAPRSDQLNSDDLIAGPRTLKITGAQIVEGDRGGKKITLNFEGDNGKPWKPCKTMGRAMTLVWAVSDEAQFIGKSVTVYRDPEVSFGDQRNIGGIRISHMSHIDSAKSVKLTVSQGKKSQFVFQPLTADVAPIRPAKQTAEQWAGEQAGAAQVCATLDSLADLIERGAKAMDRLKASKPELFAKVNDVYADARAALEAPGKPDADMGEWFADADFGADEA